MLASGIAILLILLCSFQIKPPRQDPLSAMHNANDGERIYLHLDRYLYMTGDRLWYKAYVIDARNQDYFSESKVLYLELYNSEKKKVTQQILKLDKGQAHGDIFISDTLGSGVYILSAYTSWMRNYDASSFYRKHIMVYNRFETPDTRSVPETSHEDSLLLQDSISEQLIQSMLKTGPAGLDNTEMAHADIRSGRLNYGIRQKVDIDILITRNSVPVSSCFSVSAAKVPPVDIIDNHTMNELYETLISGSREDDPKSKYLFQQENKGLLLKGELVWKHDGEPVADKRLLLAIPDSVPTFDYCHTDQLGRFCFVLDKDFTSSELYLQFEDKNIAADSVIIRWENNYMDSIDLPYNIAALPEINYDYLLSQRKRIAIGHAYGIDQELFVDRESDLDQVHQYPFYGTPAAVIYPEEYLPLPNLKEIARELLTTTRFTGQPGRYSLDIFNPVTRSYMAQSFILLDGVPVYDFDKIANLGSSDLDRIEIQNTTRVYGDMVFEGIVAMYTKGKLINSMDLSDSHLAYQFPKFKRPATPIMPYYQGDDEKNKRVPDFRDLLYWGPVNHTGTDGKARLEFFTSDETGLFRITIEGIALDGVPFSQMLDFNVVTDE